MVFLIPDAVFLNFSVIPMVLVTGNFSSREFYAQNYLCEFDHKVIFYRQMRLSPGTWP